MKLKYNFYAQTLIRILSMHGMDKRDIFALSGISLNTAKILESEISIEFMHNLTLLYKERLNRKHCGLEIIRELDFRNADFLGPYAFSCATLREAVQKIYAVQPQLNPLMSYELIPSDNPAKFVYYLDKRWESRFPESAREIVEFTMASGLLSAQSLTQRDIIPKYLHLKYEHPGNLDLYEEVYHCPVYFGKEENCISYTPDIMEYRIPTYNPTMQRILEDHIQKIIREHTAASDLVGQVGMIIMKGRKNKIPKEEEVASALNLSKRTLQKRLKAKKTSFLEILEDIQKGLAMAYLKSNAISNKEIAWLLGYNDISNFYRAFKRWTDMTPNEYREVNKSN